MAIKIAATKWKAYTANLARINSKAAQEMIRYAEKNGLEDRKALTDYAMALVQKYSEGSAELACEMYDAIAKLQGANVQPAEPAEVPDYGEVAKSVYGTLKQSPEGNLLGDSVSRLVKRTGADTMLRNAKRDRAEFAWIPSGDSCAFCAAIASRGWQPATDKTVKGDHAEHIHANCQCEFAIRFSKDLNVAGYDPDKLRAEYDAAEGDTSQEKINSMRRNNAKEKIFDSQRTDLDDEIIGRSIGAKFQNDDILDLKTGERYHFAEGTRLQDKEVFAGKGAKTPYRNAAKFAEKYGGRIEDWQHVKGKAVLSTPDGDRKAEIHWSQCENIGKKDFFIKRWMEE